ncbi:protein of unknown function [Taphrina deformans PYCC 5710]|uniref:Uncharacterized protein n=1 Tax=Taphrina deformans (strain PYCC 5710 / ATCC 11124 / CBS 356.35 / IMI 108563 / JCM 9778 / NBRC 8474) TaxID=1097556 RepID=R4XN89_TAPDE|nr:protein of unknown function [Taphrina deformans PYCC 5710]|eukprot:CCG84709.1 protein of unknown function [Taphrina deformans PYCC 5710]
MTTTTGVAPSIAPLSDSDPSSASIRDAARGHGAGTDWSSAKAAFNARLEDILARWGDVDARPYTTQIASFPAPPHTVQRLAELLERPTAWYTDPQKFIRALVRVLSVTSTTVDYAEAAEPLRNVHPDESLLVPIPWLQDAPTDGSPLGPITASSLDPAAATTTTTSTTTMGNGVRVTVNGRIDAHFEHSLPQDPGAAAVPGPGSSGTAPMDAADYGPQSDHVKEAIAMNGSSAGHTATHALAGGGEREGNGRVEVMDTSP